MTWNADWAAKCHVHNLFEQANNVFGHAEDPALPGYSEDGNWAGTHSVLSGGGSYQAAPQPGEWLTPFEWAPIHLIQMLAPGISQVGGDQLGENGLSCITTWPGYTQPPASDTPRFYSYPGNGTTGIYGSEQAAESPTTPEAELGLGATTGPNLFVYAEGFDSSTLVATATLADDSGRATELAWWDASLSSLHGYSPAGSVMLIPKTELVGHTHYTISVTLTDPRPATYGYILNTKTKHNDRVVTHAAYNAQAAYTFTFTTGTCDVCRHLPDQPTGLLDLRPGPGATVTVSSNGQTEHASFTVAHLRTGNVVKHICRSGLSATQKRGHSACAVWTPIGRFRPERAFGDGDTAITLASLLHTKVAGRYRVTTIISGMPKTVELSA